MAELMDKEILRLAVDSDLSAGSLAQALVDIKEHVGDRTELLSIKPTMVIYP